MTDGSGVRVVRHRRARTRPRSSRLTVVLAAAGMACALVAALTAAESPRGSAEASWIWPPAPQLAGDPPRVTDPPTRLRIPSIGVDGPLETIDIDRSGALAAPRDFAKAGWYGRGVAPGDPGPAVIAGHVDSKTGPAVFSQLYQLRAGDTVEVERAGRRVTFRVVSSGQYAKAKFPSEKVYAPTPVPELRLITCGGTFEWSRLSYQDNIIVFAVLI